LIFLFHDFSKRYKFVSIEIPISSSIFNGIQKKMQKADLKERCENEGKGER
jgi:hypothetical protein